MLTLVLVVVLTAPGLQDGFDEEGVLRLIEEASGARLERSLRTGPVEIRPERADALGSSSALVSA